MESLKRPRVRAVSFGLLLLALSYTAFGRQDGDRAEDRAWPKVIEAPGARITVYEPQLESLKGNRLRSRAAISVVSGESTAPVFGGLWLDADLDIDPDRRTATPRNVKVTDIRFPNLEAAEAAEWRQIVASEFADWKLTFSLDKLLSELKLIEERRASAQALKADVPQILFRSHPAVLLAMEGEPAWREVPESSYQRLANSAFFVVQDRDSGICFLRIAPFWWIARGPMGPWEPIGEAPAAIAALWKSEPQPHLPTGDGAPDAVVRPEVIPVNQPSELVWTDGPPEYAPIAGTSLLYVKNTESDVFLDIPTQHSFVLLSGRWYRTESDKVAWEFVPADRLPLDFSRIPLSSEKQHVLACVAGTPQAREAMLNAKIPQTEAVKPGQADLAVRYDGEPQFTEVPESPVRYAVNTPCAVLCVYGRYYCCEDGIWYDSDCATGPWLVSTWVPPVIYLIPPSCPYYYVTYCRIFSVTPGAIYCGYYPGYRGCYVWGGTVVYGTGWRYRCWSGSYWIPRPVTWGCGVRYSLPSCSWTLRIGGAGTCAWTGVYRSPSWRSPVVTVGAGGCWSGVATYRSTPDVRRRMAFLPPPRPNQAPNLYRNQPERIVPPQPVSSGRDHPMVRRPMPDGSSHPGTNPPAGPGVDRHPPQTGHRDEPPTPPAPGRREIPSAPVPPAADHPDGPRRTPLPPPHENPRTPPSNDPSEGPRKAPQPPPRENPRTPPSDDRSDGPRKAPQPPPPRENPRTPPPAPPRESPKMPPPAPPPREHREPPRQPPPPPPPEHREPPRQPPPPPPREHHEPPRNPPPPPPPPREHHEQRDQQKDPPWSPGRR